MTRILVVDDEPQITRFLKPSLKAAGYDVIAAADGREALKLAATQAPDLVLLDLGLPDIDGKAVIEAIRTWSTVPIIVVSARDREQEKIAAFDLGADDYVNKPFGIGELLARVRTALRHASKPEAASPVVSAGPVTIDILDHTASIDRVPLKLTRKEFDVLRVLVQGGGRLVTHRQMLSAIWGPAHSEDLQYLRVVIAQLRQKLQAAGAPSEIIHTELGVGYRLEISDEPASTPGGNP